jgi:hypothetical protein
MVDKNISDAIENAEASALRATDAAQNNAGKGAEAAREYVNRGYSAARDCGVSARDYANKGYDAAREYADAGMDVAARMSGNLAEFVRNEPWIAVAAAFAVGYVAARIMRRLSI